MNKTHHAARLIGLFLLFTFATSSAGADQPASGTIITHSPASTKIFLGSPSIVTLPTGAYIVSHDTFGPASNLKTTHLFTSADRGRTWKPLATLDGQYWSTLFLHKRALYLLGTSAEYGHVVIRRSTDAGKTWTSPTDSATGLLRADGKFHCAPVPVIEHNGRLWRAMEDANGPGGWGSHFRCFMMSASVDSDLLNATSWTSSEPLARNPQWLGGNFNGWLEGNAVVTPDGAIADILRVDDSTGAGERAALVHISADGMQARFDPDKDFLPFPGGAKKFTIRFDPATKRYFALSNPVVPPTTSAAPGAIRNTLALITSTDLHDWNVQTLLLHHPDRSKHAFQYADWQFEGDDLIAAVRTAYDDAAGGADRGHDANFITFHRFPNFRALTMKDAVAIPAATSVTLETPDISLTATGAELATLDTGVQAFTNRDYTWEQVPPALKGWRYTRVAGGEPALITVKARRTTTITVATVDAQPGATIAGWTLAPDLAFTYNDREHSRMRIYRRELKEAEALTLPQGNWSGMLLLLPPLPAQ